MRVNQLYRPRQEGDVLNFTRRSEQNGGWRLEGKTAYRTLAMVVMEGQGSADGEKTLE